MANTPISPKVTAGSAVAAIVGLLLQYANTITPDTFAFLGKGQGLAFMVVTLGVGALAAWSKNDPLRTALTDAVPSKTPTPDPVPEPAPPVVDVPVEAPAEPVAAPAVLLVNTPAASAGAHAAP